MKQRIFQFAFVALALALALCVFAAPTAVTYDENGDISPPAAKGVISNACSAVVAVDLAQAKAEVLQEVASIATTTMEDANALLTKHTDYVLLDLVAVGVSDALAHDSETATAGEIRIVDVSIARRQSATDVTLTWQYVTGSFTAPQIIASATVTNGSVYASVPQTEPVQISWGESSAYRATATVDHETFGRQAFFKIEATPNAPVDDGQVFNVFADGSDYTLDLIPTNRYRVRIVSGRITSVQLVEAAP